MSEPSPASRFQGTDRFQILRQVGQGGVGIVYEALDRQRNQRVALKTLRYMDPESLLGFKKEFRSIQDIAHPNLVTLHELVCDEDRWFFTMELVEGSDLIRSVRQPSTRPFSDEPTAPVFASPTPAPIPFDEQSLRSCLGQLARGLIALHDNGKVHRDIKPSNVLVTPAGRTVILDFGLATGATRAEQLTDQNFVVGTIDYMAPEQAAALPVGPEADWYSVGVCLFQALTEKLPFPGQQLEVLMRKQKEDAPSPLQFNPRLPMALVELCSELLRINPAERPDGRSILRRLGFRNRDEQPTPPPMSQAPLFVGRRPELEQLEQAFARLEQKQSTRVFVSGESGVGKSSVVRHFLSRVTAKRSDAVVLAGRCYERESVPYKAVDGVIDALSRFMTRLEKADAAVLLPRHASMLAQVFPVLARISAIAEAPRPAHDVLDPHELRSRVFQALRELLARLADRHPVVLVIDDLQWADADSLTLLEEVMRAPDGPALLLVATVRPAAELHFDLRACFSGPQEHIALTGLSAEEGTQLAQQIIQSARPDSAFDAEAIAAEAAGHPLFIDELIRYVAEPGDPSSSTAPVQLAQALGARITRLDPEARNLIDLVALAGGPLVQDTAQKAAGVSRSDFFKLVGALRVAHLIRTTGTRDTDWIETYHDRMRRAVLALMSADALKTYHQRLAVALETSQKADPEALAIHWQGAGDLEKAAHFASIGAQKAAQALAFERAAQLYETCLQLHPRTDKRGRELRVLLAEALANAGRGKDAAEAYLLAAETAPISEALEFRRRAGEQLLFSGHVDEGLMLLRSVLSSVGLGFAETPARALLSLLFHRAQIRMRGTKFGEREPGQITSEVLRKVDTCWSAAVGLGTVDTIRGADFQTRHLLLALSAGEPYRVARALSVEAIFASHGSDSSRRRGTVLLKQAAELANRIEHPHAVAFVKIGQGIHTLYSGKWDEARTLLGEADRILSERCTGVAWERILVVMFRFTCLYYLGEYSTLQREVFRLIRSSEARGDLFATTNLRLGNTNIAWLVGDDPQEARREADFAIAKWSQGGFLAQHYYHLLAMINIDLYQGNGPEAWKRITTTWPALRKSMFLRVKAIRIQALHLRASSALLAAQTAKDKESYLRSAAVDAQKMAKEGLPWAGALASLTKAAILHMKGNSAETCVALAATRNLLRAESMTLHAAAAQYREGQLIGGSEGVALMTEASQEFARQEILNPPRMLNVLAPGFSG